MTEYSGSVTNVIFFCLFVLSHVPGNEILPTKHKLCVHCMNHACPLTVIFLSDVVYPGGSQLGVFLRVPSADALPVCVCVSLDIKSTSLWPRTESRVKLRITLYTSFIIHCKGWPRELLSSSLPFRVTYSNIETVDATNLLDYWAWL
jgi:hypothetical protein